MERLSRAFLQKMPVEFDKALKGLCMGGCQNPGPFLVLSIVRH